MNLYKTHPGLFTSRDFQLYKGVKDKVKAAVAEHFNLDNDKLYLSHPTFFSGKAGLLLPYPQKINCYNIIPFSIPML